MEKVTIQVGDYTCIGTVAGNGIEVIDHRYAISEAAYDEILHNAGPTIDVDGRTYELWSLSSLDIRYPGMPAFFINVLKQS
ncbi:hypothetical protein ACRYI5_01750 [Furfurilactobacillus sp. WILCCON 0119]|uniref:hypothetical protein n=1 Tax=Furfurilactobacillus entadae TaxID=2922307 RepID=UPI0035F0CC20